MSEKLRAVFDTNVFLRSILSKKSHGVAAALWSLFQSGSFLLITSEPLLKELYDTLNVPELAAIHKWPLHQVQDYLQSLREIAIVTPGTTAVEVPALAMRDASDIAFLVAAIEGKASYLVTQDRDLLDIDHFPGITILDPLAFLKILRAL
jgi:putative PIN family toxin of toxin-antitoxin system